MIKLQNDYLMKISGGFSLFYGWFTAAAIFITGFLKGFTNPKKC